MCDLSHIIDDLKVLWALKGVETIDVATGHKFNMRAMVLWTINDFLDRISLSGWSGQGYLACPTCNKDTPSRLLPCGLQQYLPDEVAKPIIELCSFFKRAYSPRWMFPFKIVMKKLKGYVRNKAKPKGSIVEGYVVEEALTFSSHYFWDVTTKFNRFDRNVDPRSLTCQFQVFRSICKLIGLQSVIRFDAQEFEKVTWYVLHNSPEIDTYRSQFKSKFPNKDMKEEFPNWFGSQIRQRHVDNDLGVSATNELFVFACGPTATPIPVNSCVENGVRFVVHNRDEFRTTQNIDIYSPGGKDGEMYYGQLQEILKFLYLSFKVVLFRVKWFDTSNEGRKVKHLVLRNNMTQILTKGEAFKDDQYILTTQVKQCFYFEDMARRQPHWKVVEHVNHKKFSDGGVIVVEEDPDVIHFDNSFDLPLSTSLSDLDNATLHIDGQSTEVDAPPDIIDLDEDDDIIDDEDALPPHLAYSNDEDLVNVDDDDGVEMSADVARGHDDDDRPPTHHIPIGCGGCFVNRDKGTRKPNLGERKTGRLHTRQETWNLGLKKITDDKGPVSIRIEWDDKKTLMPLAHWVINPETGTYDVESIRRRRPQNITSADWDAQIAFWNDPRNQARAAQNRQNRAKSTVVCRQGSRSLAPIRDQMMESSATREYPSLIHTFFVTNTVNGEEMLRLQALGSNTPSSVPYTEEEINAQARKGKQRGNLPGVGRVLPGWAIDVLIPPPPPSPQCTHNSDDVEKLKKKNNGSGGCGDDEMADDEDGGEDEEYEEDGDIARERIPGELSPSTYPGRHVARDEYPQRHVAREGVKMSLRIVVMATSVISISSDSSEDSTGTPAGRVILFGTIPTTIPDTTPLIVPPTKDAPTIPPSPDYTPASLDYSPASEAESDPSEDLASGHIPPLPPTSPFLSSDDDTTVRDTPDTPPSPTLRDHLSYLVAEL
nr:hypothetical protein [Tanacetum cinerariifolium]